MKFKRIRDLKWKILNHSPNFIRQQIVRSKLDIFYHLDPKITFKIADTEDELEQAMKLVYETYVKMGFIDEDSLGMSLSPFQSNPNSVVLIVKYEEQVLGCLSILADSGLGLPSDKTWNLESIRSDVAVVGEVSSLVVKSNKHVKKGELFIPLCKFMYRVAKDFLKIDAVIASTDQKVECFYTDILLFRKRDDLPSQNNKFVKGKMSSCCVLYLNSETEKIGRSVYGRKSDRQNLFKYMIDIETPNFEYPKKQEFIQEYAFEKNLSLMKLFDQYPDLKGKVSNEELNILKNLDVFDQIEVQDSNVLEFKRNGENNREARLDVRLDGSLHDQETGIFFPVKIVDLSKNGVKVNFNYVKSKFSPNDGNNFQLIINLNGEVQAIDCRVRWKKGDYLIGCSFEQKPLLWDILYFQTYEQRIIGKVA